MAKYVYECRRDRLAKTSRLNGQTRKVERAPRRQSSLPPRPPRVPSASQTPRVPTSATVIADFLTLPTEEQAIVAKMFASTIAPTPAPTSPQATPTPAPATTPSPSKSYEKEYDCGMTLDEYMAVPYGNYVPFP